MGAAVPRAGTPHEELRADCSRCQALCCVAPAFERSSDFALTKPAGTPCPNLLAEHRCGIHETLREKGFRGCTVYDCFGAGQKLVQHTFAGRSWRTDGAMAAALFAALPVMRQLHEMLWYLDEAAERTREDDLRVAARQLRTRLDDLTLGPADALTTVDLGLQRREVGSVLAAVSLEVRRGRPAFARDHAGADLVGARLGGADLRGACLRGAYLMGADLTGADLRHADLLGTDLRGATIADADLRDALYLVPAQLAAATGTARLT